jgi:cytochrome c-type biogenesis protein CcmH/NrfG
MEEWTDSTRNRRGMIHRMERAFFWFLPIGFLIGFSLTYLAVKDRDFPVVVRDTSSMASESFEAETRLIAELEERLEADPDDAESLIELGNLYITVGGFQRAADVLTRAVEISPGDPELKADLGLALYSSGSVSEAVTQFEETLRIQPNHPQTLFNMGIVMLEQLNDPAGAIEYWERMIELNPGHPQTPMVQEQIERLKTQFE